MNFDSHKEARRDVELFDGNTRVTIDPLGCRIVGYHTNGLPWLMPPDESCPGTFPMIPFASRIRAGRFSFEGRAVKLLANNPPEVHAIHGHTWQCEWKVLDSTAHRAVLVYRHAPNDWPWRYHAEVVFVLRGMQLDIQVSVTNDHGHRMPFGIGWHPYFPVTRLCSVTTAVTHQWLLDDELFPLRKVTFRHSRFKPGRERLDTVFAGWNRQLTIRWPEKGATLSMQAESPYDYLVLYCPGNEFFCAEPVSNLPDAFNAYAGEYGARALEPGATARASLSLRPEIEDERAS